MLTHKAVRAVIELGSIELDCLQFPDGSYHFYVFQSSIAPKGNRYAYIKYDVLRTTGMSHGDVLRLV